MRKPRKLVQKLPFNFVHTSHQVYREGWSNGMYSRLGALNPTKASNPEFVYERAPPGFKPVVELIVFFFFIILF